jgi:hypothetical protein
MTARRLALYLQVVLLLSSTYGHAIEPPSQPGPAVAETGELTAQQSERLQQISGRVLQAFKVRETMLQHEIEAVRTQMRPVQDALATLEKQLEDEVRLRDRLVDRPDPVQLAPLSALDSSPQPVTQEFDPTHPRGALARGAPPRVDRPTPQRLATSKPQPKAQDRMSLEARRKHDVVLQHLAALENGQLPETEVLDRSDIADRMAELRNRLQRLQGDPASMLAEVRSLRLSLQPPPARPYIKSGPTDEAGHVPQPESDPRPTPKRKPKAKTGHR